jgi:predicted MFS family arabinose efflux permease
MPVAAAAVPIRRVLVVPLLMAAVTVVMVLLVQPEQRTEAVAVVAAGAVRVMVAMAVPVSSLSGIINHWKWLGMSRDLWTC